MKIGILGAGRVGSSLGSGWARHGHEIMFSSREPNSEKMQTLISEIGRSAQAGTVTETVRFGEVIVVALPSDSVESTLRSVMDWSGKMVIDATNRFTPPQPGQAASIAEDIARWVAPASVIKAFNTIGAEMLSDPVFGTVRASMLICGDDASAKQVVSALASSLEFDVVDCGALNAAAMVENMAKLWVHLAVRQNMGRNIAFRLLQK
jgi:8-hydroxy-5-deazaflavin:NADPH oxidoreductase